MATYSTKKSGSGNRGRGKALAYMLEAFERIGSDADVLIVKYEKKQSARSD